MHRTGLRKTGAMERAASQRSQVGKLVVRDFRLGRLVMPADVVAIHAGLLHDLLSAAVMVLWRSVAGQNQQRNTVLRGFAYCRKVICACGARCAKQRDRPTARAGQAERKEGRR